MPSARARHPAAPWTALACAAAAAFAPPALAAEGDAWGASDAGAAASEGRVFGRLRADYRYEMAHLESGRDIDDQDIFFTATAGTEKLLLENLETRVSARWSKDIDGAYSEESGAEEWIDLRDVRHRSRQLLFLTQAYARLTDVGEAVDVTAGRQYAQEVEWAHFDGVSVASDRKNGNPWSAGAFVGRRVDFWRTLEHQAVVGGHAGWRFGQVDLAASDVYLVRNSLELRGTASTEEGDLGPVGGMAQVTYKQIDERPDIARLFLNPRVDATGTDISVLYEHKFRTGRKTFNFDYVSIDGDIDRLRFTEVVPYDRLEVKAWQRIVEPLGVYAAVDMLRLTDEGEADGFNASYIAPSGGLDLNGWPSKGTTASTRITYSNFHRPPVSSDEPFDGLRGTGEEDWLEVMAEVRQSFGRALHVGLEYVYEEFNMRTRFADVGRIRAQSWRVYAKVRPLEGLSIRVDLFLCDDLPNVYEDDLDRAEGAWVSVEYSF